MTKERKNIQIILLFIGLLILFATYFLYPKIKSDKLSEDITSKQDQATIEKSPKFFRGTINSFPSMSRIPKIELKESL